MLLLVTCTSPLLCSRFPTCTDMHVNQFCAYENPCKPHYHPAGLDCKRFWDNVFLVCPHRREDLGLFLSYMNSIDSIKKIQFTMEVAKEILEFLDLGLEFDIELKCILQIFLLRWPIVLHTYFLTCVFQKTTLKTFLKVLRYM